MNYAQLSKLNRAQLIDAQGEAMMNCDHATLRRIAKIMTGFKPDAMVSEEPSNSGFTYIKDEVEDANPAGPHTIARSKYDDFLTRSFWAE